MSITVRFFAAARDLVGQDSLVLEISEGDTIAHLKRRLATDYPPLAPLLRHSMIAVGREYAGDAAVLVEGNEVAVIPPVSGG